MAVVQRNAVKLAPLLRLVHVELKLTKATAQIPWLSYVASLSGGWCHSRFQGLQNVRMLFISTMIQIPLPKSVIIYWLLAQWSPIQSWDRESPHPETTQKLGTVTAVVPVLQNRKAIPLWKIGWGRQDAPLTLVFLCYFHETKFQSALFFKSANWLYIVKDRCFHGWVVITE